MRIFCWYERVIPGHWMHCSFDSA